MESKQARLQNFKTDVRELTTLTQFYVKLKKISFYFYNEIYLNVNNKIVRNICVWCTLVLQHSFRVYEDFKFWLGFFFHFIAASVAADVANSLGSIHTMHQMKNNIIMDAHANTHTRSLVNKEKEIKKKQMSCNAQYIKQFRSHKNNNNMFLRSAQNKR